MDEGKHESDDGELPDAMEDDPYTDAVGGTIDNSKELYARKEFNLCPLCWMPLFIDRKNAEDEHWCSVQYVFKGKPAFSIKASGLKHERPVYVFGFSELDKVLVQTTVMVSCQDCHFIHTSTDSMARIMRSWDKVGEKKKIQPENRVNVDDSAMGFLRI